MFRPITERAAASIPCLLGVALLAGCADVAPLDGDGTGAATAALTFGVADGRPRVLSDALAALGSGPAAEVCGGLATNASTELPALGSGKVTLTLAFGLRDTCPESPQRTLTNHASAADVAIPKGAPRVTFVAPPGLERAGIDCLVFVRSVAEDGEVAYRSSRHSSQAAGGGTYLDVPPRPARAGVVCASRDGSPKLAPLPWTLTWKPPAP
ncbi:MAG: hypothetical protein JNL38_09125 [Myxococcales bacterium]|nr:hypothetical protein [Myxococcales bacterium]